MFLRSNQCDYTSLRNQYDVKNILQMGYYQQNEEIIQQTYFDLGGWNESFGNRLAQVRFQLQAVQR